VIVWGWLVTLYLFLGGLSGGLFTVASFLYLSGAKKYERSVKWISYWAWIIIAAGIALLVVDLGRIERAFNTMLYPQVASPMSWGSLIIVSFLIISLAFWLSFTRIPSRLLGKGIGGALEKLLKSLRTPLAVVGTALAFMTGAYTGVLLTYGRPPAWTTPALPALFLASAIATGYSAAISLGHDELEKAGALVISSKVESVIGILELAAAIVYLVAVPQSFRSVLLDFSGLFGLLFMAIFLGLGILVGEIIIPSIESRKSSANLMKLSTVLVLLGGLVLRYVIVFAAQVV